MFTVLAVVFVVAVLFSPVRHAGLVCFAGLSFGSGVLCLLTEPEAAPLGVVLALVGVVCLVLLWIRGNMEDSSSLTRRRRRP